MEHVWHWPCVSVAKNCAHHSVTAHLKQTGQVWTGGNCLQFLCKEHTKEREVDCITTFLASEARNPFKWKPV